MINTLKLPKLWLCSMLAVLPALAYGSGDSNVPMLHMQMVPHGTPVDIAGDRTALRHLELAGSPDGGKRIMRRDGSVPEGFVPQLAASLEGDRQGAYVVRAMGIRGGQAGQPGLQNGDRIVSVGGQPVIGTGDEAVAAVKALVEDAPAGAPLTIGVERNGEHIDVEVIPQEVRVGLLRGGPGLGLHITANNAALGEYFGTADGVVVLDAASDATGVRPGDILLRADDVELASPADLHHYLQERKPGDIMQLTLMRHGSIQVLEMQMPETDHAEHGARSLYIVRHKAPDTAP